MKSSTKNRDLILLAALLFMLKAAWNLPSKRSIEQAAFAESVSTEVPVPPIEHTASKPFSVHEVDQDVLTQLKDLHQQIEQTMKLIEPSSTQAAQLESMRQRLIQFKREYKHTSPAVALLGPIGYTGIVVKERRIEKGILKIVNSLNSILHQHVPQQEEYRPVKVIAEGIEITHMMLTQLTNPEINQGQEPQTVN